MRYRLLLLILFFLLHRNLIALPRTSPFTNWYNTNYITDIARTGSKLAIGSTKGFILYTPADNSFIILNKADGILENHINGIACDSENLFLFSPSGMMVLSADTDTVRNIPSIIYNIQGELKSGLVRGDTLFFGTSQLFYVWDTKGNPYNPFNTSWEPFALRNCGINTIFSVGDTIYCGTDGGVCMVPQGDFSDTTQWLWNTETDGLPSDTVTAIAYWSGELWIGTKGGIVSGNMSNWTLRNTGLGNYEINRFLAANILWTATESSPYFWVDSLSQWEPLSEGLGTYRRTRGIATDNTGKTWIGIDGDGIASLDDTLWLRLRIPGPSSSNFSDIAIDRDGEIWGVHYGGFVQEKRGKTISHFRNNSWEILNDTNELGIESAIRWVDVDQKNNKWFGIWGIDIDIDILKLSEDGIWDSLALPIANVVGSQYVDSQDNKWFSNFSSSVCKLLPDDTTWQIYSDENYLNYIVAFADDDQNMYFGSIQRGVSVLRVDNSWIKLGGLPSQQVHDLTVDEDGDLWIATTASGVVVVRDFLVVRHYTSDNSGLLGDIVHDIAIDWKNNKWFLIGNRGVSVLKSNGEWDSLTVSDGLASDLIIDDLDGLAFDAQHGYLWIATKDGISRYETGFVPPHPDPELEQVDVFPNPFITRQQHRVTFNRLPDDAQIFLYSVSMKRVRVIDEVDEVTHQAFWDGTDENNKPVNSGIYVFVIVHPNGSKKTGKIAVIR